MKMILVLMLAICSCGFGADFNQNVVCNPVATTFVSLPLTDLDSDRGDVFSLIIYNSNWQVTPAGLVRTVTRVYIANTGATTYAPDDPYILGLNALNTKPYYLQPVTISVSTPLSHGSLTFSTALGANITPDDGYLGADVVQFQSSMNGNLIKTDLVNITVPDLNTPTVTASFSAGAFLPGDTVNFFAQGSDLDHNPVTYLWDFGDGTTSTDQNPAHVFTAVGVYAVKCTVIDSGGLSSSVALASPIAVFAPDQQPTASFVTSSINATVGQPLGFDATFTTDPGNKIASYSWDFGDGTPIGSGVVLAHIYKTTGAFTTTLTVVDSNGLMNSTSVAIVVVDLANGAATPLLLYTARFNTKHNNADSLQVTAQLNPGATVTGSTPLGVSIAGSAFSGTTAGVRALKGGPLVKWTAKAVRNAPGVMLFKATVKNASLRGFPSSSGKFTTPVKLSIASRVFSAPVTNTFRFGLGGGVSGGK